MPPFTFESCPTWEHGASKLLTVVYDYYELLPPFAFFGLYGIRFGFLGVIGDEAACGDGLDDENFGASHQKSRDLLLFSGNDYLGLSSHPTIGKAAAKVRFMTIFVSFACYKSKCIFNLLLRHLVSPF